MSKDNKVVSTKTEKARSPLFERDNMREKSADESGFVTAKKSITNDEAWRKSQKYKHDKERELVRGIFHNFKEPGQTLKFVYQKYAEDQIEKYTLEDGIVTYLPVGVMNMLNKDTTYEEDKYLLDENNQPMKIIKKVRQYFFEPLEFIDMSQFGGEVDLVKVEKIY